MTGIAWSGFQKNVSMGKASFGTEAKTGKLVFRRDI